MEIKIDGDPWVMPGATGEIAYFGKPVFAQLEVKREFLPKKSTVVHGRRRHMLGEKMMNLFEIHRKEKRL
jgi:hypothetical protein